jgi:hypothetical protein
MEMNERMNELINYVRMYVHARVCMYVTCKESKYRVQKKFH